MGIYTEQFVPRLINTVCGLKEPMRLRSRVCEGLAGEVVEIGFGSGLNIPYYPPTVTRMDAVEPSDTAWRLAAERRALTNVPIHRAGLDGQSLPFEDDSHDAALSTWTLCTIPDAVTALREIRRVLRPGGSLHFVEHGLAPDENVRTWQRRLDPLQQKLVGGCHLTRPIVEMLEYGGFTIKKLDTFYEKGSPKIMGANSLGIAV